MRRTYIAPISFGLGDLIVSLPAIQALITENQPGRDMAGGARSRSRPRSADRIAGLAGCVHEDAFDPARQRMVASSISVTTRCNATTGGVRPSSTEPSGRSRSTRSWPASAPTSGSMPTSRGRFRCSPRAATGGLRRVVALRDRERRPRNAGPPIAGPTLAEGSGTAATMSAWSPVTNPLPDMSDAADRRRPRSDPGRRRRPAQLRAAPWSASTLV